MLKTPNNLSGIIAVVLSCFISTTASSAPVYKTRYTLGETNDMYRLVDFNNDGDVCGQESTRQEEFVYHNGQYLVLPQMTKSYMTGKGIVSGMCSSDSNG